MIFFFLFFPLSAFFLRRLLIFRSCFLRFLPRFRFFFLPLAEILRPDRLIIPFRSPESAGIGNQKQSSKLLKTFSHASNIPCIRLQCALDPFPPGNTASDQNTIHQPFLPHKPIHSAPTSRLQSNAAQMNLHTAFPISGLHPHITTAAIFFSFPILVHIRNKTLISSQRTSLRYFGFVNIYEDREKSFHQLKKAPGCTNTKKNPSTKGFSSC